jgi:hypothetical protein
MPKKFRLEDKYLVISLRTFAPRTSKTGKSLLIATTHGVQKSNIKIRGKVVRIVAAAFIPVDHASKQKDYEDA